MRRGLVLVIEEDVEMQDILVETLEDNGFAAHGAGSVEEVLKSFALVGVVIVISSLRAVNRLGIATHQKIQARYPGAVFIFCAEPEAIPRLDLPGLRLRKVLPTPFHLRDFTKTVRRTSTFIWWLTCKRHFSDGLAQIKTSLSGY